MLIDESISQLQSLFMQKIPMIKKCIDILIEKDYIKRVEGTRDEYDYVA
jgi:cullin 1